MSNIKSLFLVVMLALVALLTTTPAAASAATTDPQWSTAAADLGLSQVHVAKDGSVVAGPDTTLERVTIGGQEVLTARGRAPQPKAAGPVVVVCNETTPAFCWQVSAFEAARLVSGNTNILFPGNPELGIRGQAGPDRGRITAPGPGNGYWPGNYDPVGLVRARLANQVGGGCRLTLEFAEAATFVSQTPASQRPATETCEYVISQVPTGLPLTGVVQSWNLNTDTTVWTPVYTPGMGITCTGTTGGQNGSGMCTSGDVLEPLSGSVTSSGSAVTFTVPPGVTCQVITTTSGQPDCGRIFRDGFE